MINFSIPFDSLIFLVQVWLNFLLSFRQKFIICVRWMGIHYQLSTKECIILLQGKHASWWLKLWLHGAALPRLIESLSMLCGEDSPRWIFMVKWLSTVENVPTKTLCGLKIALFALVNLQMTRQVWTILRILFIKIFSLFLCLLFFYFSIVTFYEEAAWTRSNKFPFPF